MRQTWPDTGEQMLNAVQHALRHKSSGEDAYRKFYWKLLTLEAVQFTPEHSIILNRVSDSSTHALDVEVSGKPQKIIESMEQLAWVGAALKPSLTTDVVSSFHVEFRITTRPPKSPYFLSEIELLPLQPEKVTPTELETCWTSLFDRSVLAWGFPYQIVQMASALSCHST
jgi:hypothetical protein